MECNTLKVYVTEETPFLFLNTAGVGDELEVTDQFYQWYQETMVEFDAVQDELVGMYEGK